MKSFFNHRILSILLSILMRFNHKILAMPRVLEKGRERALAPVRQTARRATASDATVDG